MPTAVATLVYALLILTLFWLDRDKEARTSNALWLPFIWFSIAFSRSVGAWVGGWPATIDLSANRYIEGNPIDRYVFSGLILAGLIVLATRGQRVGALLRRNAPILLFFFYAAVSIFWSDYSDVAFKRWTKAVGDLVMILIVLTERDRLAALKHLVARVGYLFAPLSILFIKYYPALGRMYNRFSWTTSYVGCAWGKNELGYVCLILGLVCVWRLCSIRRETKDARRIQPLIAQGALLAMVLWLLWMANSMTSWACFLMVSTLIVMTSHPRFTRKTRVVHILALAMIAFSVCTIFFNTSGALLQGIGKDPTITGRTEIWSLLLSMTRKPLLGTGFESFWLGDRLDRIWSEVWWHPNEAHNGYLEVYLNLGWIGVALLALIIVTGYRNVLAAFRRGSAESQLTLPFFITGVIYNLTESAVRELHGVWIVFLLSAFAIPEPAVSEAIPTLGIHPADSFAESELEVEPVLPTVR
jgi:O-antigen ligase